LNRRWYNGSKGKDPDTVQRLTQGKEEVEGVPGSVMQLVTDLDKRFPALGRGSPKGEDTEVCEHLCE